MDINFDKEFDLIDEVSNLIGQAMTKIQMCDESTQSPFLHRRFEALEKELQNFNWRKNQIHKECEAIKQEREAMNAMAL